MLNELKGLEKICAQYLNNILKDCDQMTALLESKESLNEEEEKAVRKFGHQTYGSGSTYGFDFISDSGQNVTKAVHGKEGLDKIRAIIADLKVKIQQAKIDNHFE